MKKFALIGAAGFVAPRHMQAIKETGNQLVAALDKFDSVGILDRYFPNAAFFTEFERFDRHLEKLKRNGEELHFLTVCSPNYLHDAHIRFGLKYGVNVICEKPLVLNPWNLPGLKQMEMETNHKIFNILQLRLHPSIIKLKKKISQASSDQIFDVDLTYISARGKWYFASWKGDESKSGGIATNIGIHFFDMLTWIFGNVKENIVHLNRHDRAAGFLSLERAKVKWFLSINESTLPEKIKKVGNSKFRSLKIEGEEFEFTEGFEGLHTKSYEHILSGQGFGIEEIGKTIQLVHDVRTSKEEKIRKNGHEFTILPTTKHPFY